MGGLSGEKLFTSQFSRRGRTKVARCCCTAVRRQLDRVSIPKTFYYRARLVTHCSRNPDVETGGVVSRPEVRCPGKMAREENISYASPVPFSEFVAQVERPQLARLSLGLAEKWPLFGPRPKSGGENKYDDHSTPSRGSAQKWRDFDVVFFYMC